MFSVAGEYQLRKTNWRFPSTCLIITSNIMIMDTSLFLADSDEDNKTLMDDFPALFIDGHIAGFGELEEWGGDSAKQIRHCRQYKTAISTTLTDDSTDFTFGLPLSSTKRTSTVVSECPKCYFCPSIRCCKETTSFQRKYATAKVWIDPRSK